MWARLSAALLVLSLGAQCARAYWNIGHMANDGNGAEWALQQGANGLEMDLRFDNSTTPRRFMHGGICDCICSCGSTDHICHVMSGTGCNAATDAVAHLASLATKPQVRLIYLDTKTATISPSSITGHAEAGRNVYLLLKNTLFATGWGGRVVVSAPDIDSQNYLLGFLNALNADNPSFRNRVFITIDWVKDADATIKLLRLWKDNPDLRAQVVYSNGDSSCIPKDLTEAIKKAVASGIFADVMIWTLDKDSTMKEYINLGVTGILTNKLDVGYRVARDMGKFTADDLAHLPTVCSYRNCNCSYHHHWLSPGGCQISKAPEPGCRCKCKEVVWKCWGTASLCDLAAPNCAHPDNSRATCTFGGGDCRGY